MTEQRDNHFVITRYEYDGPTASKHYSEAFSLRQAMRFYERFKQEGADEVQICRVEFTYDKPEEKADD